MKDLLRFKMNTDSFRRFTAFGGTIIYYCILCYIYENVMVTTFNYNGFTCEIQPGYLRLISFLVLTVIAWYISFRINNSSFSNQVVFIFIYLAFIPSLVMMCYVQTDFWFMLICYYLIMLCFEVIIKEINLSFIYLNRKILETVLVVVFVGLIIFIWGYYAGFHLQTSIIDVYGQRDIANKFSMPLLLSYIYGWSGIIIPFLTVYFLHNNNWILFGVCLLGGVLSFSVNGAKTLVFTIVIGCLMYLVLCKVSNYLWLISGGLSLLSVFCYFLHKKLGFVWGSGLFFARVLFEPVKLNYKYYEFFNLNEKDYFRTAIPLVGETPYGNIPQLIGQYMGTMSSANNGLFSDAYLNLGRVGILISPLIIIVLLKIFDGLTDGMPLEIKFVLVLKIAFVLISSSFFTSLMTHGILITALILLLIDECNMRRRVIGEKMIVIKLSALK